MDDATYDVYASAGLGARQGAGTRPALIVVDLSNGFTDPASPLCCDHDGAAVAANVTLIEAARAAGAPVVFTTVAYDAAGRETAKWFLAKSSALREITPDHHLAQIDARLAPLPEEAVITKLWPSAFAGTSLAALLTARGVDTAVVTGASTSGCVRASAIDALQHGLRVVIPREAVADRAPGPHAGALFDLDQKVGDVVGLEEAVAVLAAATFATPA